MTKVLVLATCIFVHTHDPYFEDPGKYLCGNVDYSKLSVVLPLQVMYLLSLIRILQIFCYNKGCFH